METPERAAWQKPDELVATLARFVPAANGVVADIGSATGYFTTRIARALPNAHIFGLDTQPNMVQFLAKRAEDDGLRNLFAAVVSEDCPVPPEPADAVLIVAVYHHFANREQYLPALRQKIKPGGRVMIVDYHPGRSDPQGGGPPAWMRLSEEQVVREMTEAGFRLEQSVEMIECQYVLVFQ